MLQSAAVHKGGITVFVIVITSIGDDNKAKITAENAYQPVNLGASIHDQLRRRERVSHLLLHPVPLFCCYFVI